MKNSILIIFVAGFVVSGCSAPQSEAVPTEAELVATVPIAMDTEVVAVDEPTLEATATETAIPPIVTPIVVESVELDQPAVRGIILFIGDGMGEGQRTAARWLAAGQDGHWQWSKWK